jgi:hypothetical protein
VYTTVKKLLLAVLLFSGIGFAQSLDIYGGLTAKPCAGGATGKWYAPVSGPRFVFCTPLGNTMWAKGVYAVDPSFLSAGVVTTKYGTNAIWASNTALRLKSWGINTLTPYAADAILPWAIDPSYPLDGNGLHSIPTKIPTMYIVRPGFYGMNMNTTAIGVGTISVGIKDIVNAVAPSFIAAGAFLPGNGVPDWYDARYMTVLDYMLNTDPRAGQLPSEKTSPYISYLIGIAVEDSDQTWCYGSGEAYETFPPGKQQWHCSWLTASMSPIQQVHPVKQVMYNADTQVYQKTAWKNFLIARYGTIGALNTAWSTGSFYTTFGSSASTVSAEAFATTDGINYQFTHTLANGGTVQPNSIQILDGGVFIGGDCFHSNQSDVCNPGGGTTNGGVWGPTISGGSVNYSTKSTTVAYATTPVAWNTIERTTNVCTVKFFSYQPPATLIVGDKISVTTNTAGCGTGGSPVTVTVVANGGLDISYAQTGANFSPTVNVFPYGTLSKVTVPAAGHVLTVNYQVNGWNSGGTGLMDEDGSHAWMGTDIIALSNANATTAADMRLFLYQTAHDYFSATRAKVKAAFPNTLYLGPDSLTTWGVPTRKEVLQAAGQSDGIDLAILGGASTGDVYTQSMIDFTAQYYGKPGVMATFYLANADSPYGSNLPSYSFATQALRGAAFSSQISNALAATTAFGTAPWSGYLWWQYTDNPPETDNWGLATVKDNAYDGHEAVTSTVSCSSPIGAFSCGGEAGNYGNVLTSVLNTNANIDVVLLGATNTSSTAISGKTKISGNTKIR